MRLTPAVHRALREAAIADAEAERPPSPRQLKLRSQLLVVSTDERARLEQKAREVRLASAAERRRRAGDSGTVGATTNTKKKRMYGNLQGCSKKHCMKM